MSRRRYTINANGVLADRDGNALGTVVGITLDVPLEGEGGGVSSAVSEGQRNPVAPEVEEVWQHYVVVFEATRQTLNGTRRRVIQQALKARSVEECKRAIEGLRVWPWNNGENPEGREYLDIRYALKGNGQRGESNEERIDTMADRAPSSAIVAGRLPGDHPRVQRWINEVRYTISTGGEKTRGREAYKALVAAGFTVTKLDAAPWVEVA